jgi:hypothetical protein
LRDNNKSWIAVRLKTLRRPGTGKVFDGPVTVPLYVIIVIIFAITSFFLGRYWLNQGKWRILVSEQYEYSIKYPANWSMHVYGDGGARGSIYLRSSFGDFFTSDGVYIHEQTMDEPSLIRATEWSEEIIERQRGYRLSELDETVIGCGNYPALVRTYMQNDFIGRQLVYKVVYVATNERVFMLEFSAYKSRYDKAAVIFDDVLDSFQLVETTDE